MDCNEVEGLLGAYQDRELEPAIAIAVREHVDMCPECRQRLARMEAVGRQVRRAPYYTAPDALRARLVQAPLRSSTQSPWLTWAAAAVMVASLGGSVLFVQSSARAVRASDAVNALAQDVVGSHLRSLMGDHLFDVRSTDQHTVKPWFLGKLDFAPPVTDLASIGFPLTGGRLDYLEGRPVAALVYARGRHTINVFVSPDDASGVRSPMAQAIRGFHLRHWIHGGMWYWAVSDVNDSDLDQFSRALQE